MNSQDTHERRHDHGSGHGHHDWNNDDRVAEWLEREAGYGEERRRQFLMIRALIPKTEHQEFSYINLGAGPGTLDEILLERFSGAKATLVDGSLVMLGHARSRLARFGKRVEYVRADLDEDSWKDLVKGPFDIAVSTLAIHHLHDGERVRAFYGELYGLLSRGGMLLNLDLVRPSSPLLAPLACWAEKDSEAELNGHGNSSPKPGSLIEHLEWLGEAGFGAVEVLWKEFNSALFCAVRGDLQMPEDQGEGRNHGEGGRTH